MLYGLRVIPLEYWCGIVLVPAVLYAVLAEKTNRTAVYDNVVLITGASSGLGRALALECARRQCKKLILVARSEGKLKETADMCKAENKNPSFSTAVELCDLNDVKDVERMAKKVSAEHGAMGILINNAGAGAWKHIEEHTAEDVVSMLACPLQAGILLSALLVPDMIKAKTGHIMNVTSAAGMTAFRGAVGYGASRWGVRGFSKMLYWDLKEHGIGVTLLSPAEIDGTDYFKNAPGKAGGDSHNRIPSLFILVGKLGLNYTTKGVAWAGMNAVENGWSIANVPCYLAHAFVVVNGMIPFFVESIVNCGANGKRSGKTSAQQEMAAPLAQS
jgi:short-subunit dehydrogenase